MIGLALAFSLFGTGANSSAAPSSALTQQTMAWAGEPGGSGTAGSTDDASRDERTPVLASAGGLDLHLPGHDVVLVGFHQASTPGSKSLTPGAAHTVLPSRGRGQPRTSAVDVAMVDDDPVRSPVSGKVVDVERFSLYGKHGDRRVTIRPDDAPALRVVMLHISGVRVEAGDRVEAGITEIAKSARRFPFRSQIDDETAPDAWPHVHYEVKAKD